MWTFKTEGDTILAWDMQEEEWLDSKMEERAEGHQAEVHLVLPMGGISTCIQKTQDDDSDQDDTNNDDRSAMKLNVQKEGAREEYSKKSANGQTGDACHLGYLTAFSMGALDTERKS